MKQFLWIVASLLIIGRTLGQPINKSDQSSDVIQTFKKTDNITDFIYNTLDSFLANPSEQNLAILENCETLLWRPLHADDEYIAYVILLCNRGYYLARFANVHRAVDAYEKAWKLYSEQQLTGFDIIEYCLKPLGNIYSMLGDYQSAANIIKSYLYIAEKEGNTEHIVSALINLSIVYHDTGKQEETIDMLTNALNVKRIDNVKKGIIYSNLARNYLDLNNLTSAENAAELALQYLKKCREDISAVYVVNTHKTLSLINLRRGKQKLALHNITQAKQIVNEYHDVFKPRERAKLENAYASVLKLQQQYADAQQSYQVALKILLPLYTPKGANDLPARSLFYAENTIKETLDGLADLFVQKKNPHKALECLELSFAVEDLLRRTYNYQDARLQQQTENRHRAELALSLLYDIFNRTKDKKYVIKAFQIAELTKAIVLREAVEAGSRRQFMKPSLLKKERDLSYKKAMIENDLVLEQMKGDAANVNYIHDLLSRQTAISIDIKAVKEEIAAKYPHHDFDSESRPIDIAKLQRKLRLDDVALLEYFDGKESLYVFTVTDDSISLCKISESKKTKDGIRTLNDLFSSASAINSNVELYKSTAVELHDLLQIPKETNTENLLVISDGLLNYIPFEALLFEESKTTNYENLPYLMKKFTITYKPSASLYLNDTVKAGGAGKNLLAMFPMFENTGRVLKHSQQEAKNMQTHLQGNYILSSEATKKAFEENLAQYNIIHLSTHADAGSHLEPPSITFIDSTLYLPEVYGLRFQPDLLILSACETGAGKLSTGEGALSLARGFQYAGARNMIFSLWKVNDQSTALLMSSFYGYYSNENGKSRSLQKAKLDYLSDKSISNTRKSPYYWAAFVYYGDPHDTESTWSMLWYLFLPVATTLFIVAVMALMRKAGKAKKKMPKNGTH